MTRPAIRSATGFTLVEVLVVLVIIGIIATFVTLSVGRGSLEDRLKTEARRLEQLILLAEEEAQLRGHEVGFRYTTEGYEFLVLSRDGRWLRYDSGPLRPRSVPAPLRMSLYVDDKLVVPAAPAPQSGAGPAPDEVDAPADEDDAPRAPTGNVVSAPLRPVDGEDAQVPVPQVFLLSSGETTPFVLDIGADHHKGAWRLQADFLGNLQRDYVEDTTR